MLVCPRCQFENPDPNKFCQQCGTSLIYRPCPQCGTEIAWEAETCEHCGAAVGTVYYALIVSLEGTEPLATAISPEETPLAENQPLSTQILPQISQWELSGKYLDPQKRYRLIASEEGELLRVLPSQESPFSFQGRVWDSQPLQQPFLKVLQDEETGVLSEPQLTIPELAITYFDLREFSPAVPELHDAWQENKHAVLLLSDRSGWPLLTDLWASEAVSNLQLTYWLYELASLWEALSPVNCCQSLFMESNFRVGEDQTFGLQQLYPDPPESRLTFQDLARWWQQLLSRSPAPHLSALTELLEQAAKGEVPTAAQLCQRLQQLAGEQQDNPEWNLPELKVQPSELASQEDREGEIPTERLPRELFSLREASYTGVGREREHNEDNFYLKTQFQTEQDNQARKVNARGLYLVCDGMGGHAAGEVASSMAIGVLRDYFQTHWQEEFPTREIIAGGILAANQAIYQANQESESSGQGRMGTTLVMALLQGTKVAIAHVGDSRFYRLDQRRGLEQVTVDHEVGQQAIQNGVDPAIAYALPDAYQLTQALGPRDNDFLHPQIQFLNLQEDTLLLLCSDGLSDNDLLEENWQTYLMPLLGHDGDLDLEEGLQNLMVFANRQNGHDNLTAILVRVNVRLIMNYEL